MSGLLILLATAVLRAGGSVAAPAPSASAAPARETTGGAPASYIREDDYRVARIGYRLGLAGAPLCPEPYPLTGLLLQHLAEYSAEDRAQAAELYGLDRGPGVLAVIEDSPAARANLRAGDVLLAVNDRPLPSPTVVARGRDNEEARPLIEQTEALLETELHKGPARLSIWREGREVSVLIKPVTGCPARVRLARSDQVNAFANRGYAIMTTALLDFLRSDDELAIVLGHEIAHTILHHQTVLDAQGVPQGILRGFGKNARRVRATEEQADRLGLKLAWRAGYDVSAAIPYWRRYYGQYAILPQLFRTHPSLHDREQLIRETIAGLGATGSKAGAERPELGEGALRQR